MPFTRFQRLVYVCISQSCTTPRPLEISGLFWYEGRVLFKVIQSAAVVLKAKAWKRKLSFYLLVRVFDREASSVTWQMCLMSEDKLIRCQ